MSSSVGENERETGAGVTKKSKTQARRERKKKNKLKWAAENTLTNMTTLETDTTAILLPESIHKQSDQQNMDQYSEQDESQSQEDQEEVRQVVWTRKEEFAQDTAKYWFQRFSLFHRYSEGIRLDETGWFSVTPEVIAMHIANRFAQTGKTKSVIDAFCGVGGNSIAFARKGLDVIAIEIDRVRLDCARHNARVYGVEDRITFIHGDFLKIADEGELEADSVFLSPPWGGISYMKAKVFDIETMPINGITLFNKSRAISKNICYFLPRSVNHSQLTSLLPEDDDDNCIEDPEVVELEEVYLDDRTKCMNAYYGNLSI